MLQFEVYLNGAPAQELDLSGAYAFGQDGTPVRAELTFGDGQISCVKRVAGACGLALLWSAGQSGSFMLSTTRLPDRPKPYNLNVELARAQMMRIAQKREDWGLFDYTDAEELNKEFLKVHKYFTESLKADDPAEAAALADKALAEGVTVGERIALFHADIFLSRRLASNFAVVRTGFGCKADLLSKSELYLNRLQEVCDFVSIDTPWKHIEPKENQYRYEEIDAWMNWAAQAGKPVHAGPLLCFSDAHVPDWLYIWEHDYEALRDVIYEHIQRLAQRYKKQVRVWKVAAGIHARNCFNLSFEQIMELTRISCLLVKQIAPDSQVIIDLTMPFGEYYARNQRTIPPMLYADMAIQSGIKFDAFGLQMHMGVPVDGHYVRDLMQISSLLDRFVGFREGLHVTACQVPSDMSPDAWDAWEGKESVAKAGRWHAPWSQRLQAEWLQAFYRIAISKPFVETICWNDLADYEGHYIPHGGLCRNDLKPKLSYRELRNFKAHLISSATGVIDQQSRKSTPQEDNEG